MSDNSLRLQGEFFKRKPDEIYNTFQALHDYNLSKQFKTRQQTVNLAEIEARAVNGDLIIHGNGRDLVPTNYAYNKLVTKVGGSQQWFDKLDAPGIAYNLNYGFKSLVRKSKPIENLNPWEIDESGRAVDTNAKLIYSEDSLINVTSATYNLVFDAQLSELALKLEAKYGLRPAPANKGWHDTKEITHHGLYASDRNCFIFASTLDKPVLEFASSPIYRGVMLWNGFDTTFGVSLFLLSGVCCNYSIHGFTEKFSLEARHSAKLWEKMTFDSIADNLSKAFDASTKTEQKFLDVATRMEIGQDKNSVVKELVKLHLPLLHEKASERVYDLAVEREEVYGNPRTVWSIGNVITEIGRDRPFADARRSYMEVAKKVFDMAEAQVV